MLRSANHLRGYWLDAQGRGHNRIVDLLVDTKQWRVTHVVVKTFPWLGRRVRVPVSVLGVPRFRTASITTTLTREAVGHQPPFPATEARREAAERRRYTLKRLRKHGLQATDGPQGALYDLLIHDEDWSVGGLVAQTHRVLVSRLVIVPRERLGDVSPRDKTVLVDLSSPELKSLPPFEPQRPVNEVLERVTYDYYGRQHSLRRAE